MAFIQLLWIDAMRIERCFILGKHFTRKDSADSGISAGSSSRKTSTVSNISASASILEEPSEETIKEETPFSEPDEELCEKITTQVTLLTRQTCLDFVDFICHFLP